MLGALQTIKCMLKFKVNIVTNYISKSMIFCQFWYTIFQTLVLRFFPEFVKFCSSCLFLKINICLCIDLDSHFSRDAQLHD